MTIVVSGLSSEQTQALVQVEELELGLARAFPLEAWQ